jgi:hypothetical protein
MKDRLGTWHRHALRALLVLASLGMTTAAVADSHRGHHYPPSGGSADTTPLIQKVRSLTQRFRDVNVAIGEGWAPGTPCVSGPDAGAMGVHFLLPAGIPSELDVSTPAALIYEPMGDGSLRFVGVEYILMAAPWDSANPGQPPVLEGNLLNLVGEPNRFGLHAFYELHVWAWQDNPKGSFADWNTLVTCNRQPGGS